MATTQFKGRLVNTVRDHENEIRSVYTRECASRCLEPPYFMQFVDLLPVPIVDENEVLLGWALLKVFGFVTECQKEGFEAKEWVQTACNPPFGVGEHVKLYLSGVPEVCYGTNCPVVDLWYDEEDERWHGEIGFTLSTIYFELYCTTETDPITQAVTIFWWLVIRNCGPSGSSGEMAEVTYQASSFCQHPLRLDFGFWLFSGADEFCCEASPTGFGIGLTVYGPTKPHFAGRAIDLVVHNQALYPVYGYAECCVPPGCGTSSLCCPDRSVPLTLTLTLSGAGLDQSVVLTFVVGSNPPRWCGTVIGPGTSSGSTTNNTWCLSCEGCSSGESPTGFCWRLSGGITECGLVVAANAVEVSCDPFYLQFPEYAVSSPFCSGTLLLEVTA